MTDAVPISAMLRFALHGVESRLYAFVRCIKHKLITK